MCRALCPALRSNKKINEMIRKHVLVVLAGCFILSSLPEYAEAQQRSFYQQTDYKGQEIGKLTGDIYYARFEGMELIVDMDHCTRLR